MKMEDESKTYKSSASASSKHDESGIDKEDKAEDTKEGVKVPEEFQVASYDLIKGASKEHLAYLRNCINEKEDELRKKEMEAAKKKMKKGKHPATFTADAMPGGSYD